MRGLAAGGAAYGYSLEKRADGSAFQVNPQQACWVVHIFKEFAAGRSVQRIAAELNSHGVPSPRGKGWSVSGLYGSPNKGSGILNNELYIGRYIWNRSAWKNDPDTQKRIRKDLPREQWVIHEKPELRLVDDDLWFAVRARIDAKNLKPGKGKGRPARTLFGGQLRCPQCFGAFIAVNSRSYGCVRRKDQGPQACSNQSFVRRAVVDGGLLDVVRQEVLSDAASGRFEQELRARLAAESNAGRAHSAQYLSKQLTETLEQISRLVDGIKTVGMSAALSTALVEAERAKEDISRRLAVARQPKLDTERAVRKAVADYVQNGYESNPTTMYMHAVVSAKSSLSGATTPRRGG